jgi:predicted amidohydrolase YtcJ
MVNHPIAGNGPPALAPSLVLLNASIRTMDPNQPVAEAAAIRGEKILALGSTAQIEALAGAQTRRIDAQGNTVLPGFNDAHVHFLTGGFSLCSVDLRGARTGEEMARRLEDFGTGLEPGTWVRGGDWDHENWPGSPLPTRQLIDAQTPNHPVFITRLDGHMALANSLALQLAGVTRATEDPPGGLIVREPRSLEPTGLLKDAAMDLVNRAIPPRTPGEKRQAALAATQHAARLGVTSVADMSAGQDLRIYQQLAEEGALKTRIYGAHPITDWELLARVGVSAGFGHPLVRMGVLKGFADGSLGSSTALFFAPYLDTPETRGLLFEQMFPEGVMLERTELADRLGLQVMIHAIGDEANWRILELYQQVAARNGWRDRRFRIEHAQHLRPTEIPRFGQQQVVASMQPCHLADDARWCERKIGPERARGTFAFRSLLDSGAQLAFGSDWTVAPLNPLLGIKAAVTRQTLDGRNPNGWQPAEKITLDEAIRAYTVGSAFAEFAEEIKGTLRPGCYADLVMLDRDIYTADPAELDRAQVLLTVMNGEIVYET